MNWYDEKSKLTQEMIVGWRVFYTDGMMYSFGEDKPEDLPKHDVQVLHVYLRRTPEGKLGRIVYTGRDDYPIPNSDVVVHGDWTTDENHDARFWAADKIWWPDGD